MRPDILSRIFRRVSLCCIIAVAAALVYFIIDRPRPTTGAQTGMSIVFVRIAQDRIGEGRGTEPASAFVDRYADGYEILGLSLDDPDAKPKVLSSGFASARDPAISFDGRHIMFAGKRNHGDPWQIWRMDRDGSNLVQVTRGKEGRVAPVYAGNLFHLNDKQPVAQFVCAGRAGGQAGGNGEPSGFALYSSDLDGGNERRITFNLSSDSGPEVLSSGRVVFSSLQPFSGSSVVRSAVLMAVNIDGTDLAAYAERPPSPRDQEMVMPDLSSGRIYFIESEGRTQLGGGDLAFVSERRPLHSRTILSPAGQGLWHSPCPLPDGRLLASFQPAAGVFGLYEVDPVTGRIQRSVYTEPRHHIISARPLGPRPRAPGRSSVVGFKHRDTGVFYCLSVYTSELEGVRGLRRGTVTGVRVLEGGSSGVRVLGTAPVEEDGSFHIRVPAETPLAFQLLDEGGKVLAQQNTWTWVMPGESRGCVGCHEDRELVPENRLAAAIVKPEVPLPGPVAELPAARSKDVPRP